ncbi:Smt3-specific protease [Pleurotus pulmonarius]|nr:Smt3-specific protease [Pleurotus pulmonarius]
MATSHPRSSTSSNKRPAPEQLERPAKHRRTTRRTGMEQRTQNATKTLSQRWISYTIDGFKLLLETVSHFLPGDQPNNLTRPQESPQPSPLSSPPPSPIPAKPLPPPSSARVSDGVPLTPHTYLNKLKQKNAEFAQRATRDPRSIPLPPSPPPPTERQTKRKSYMDNSPEAGNSRTQLPNGLANMVASSSKTPMVNGFGRPTATSSNSSGSKRLRKSQNSSPSIEIIESSMPPPPPPQRDHTTGSFEFTFREHAPTQPIPHKQRVQEERIADRLEMEKELYSYERRNGYQSSLSDFKGLLSYRAALEKVQFREALSPSASLTDLRELAPSSNRNRRYSFADADGVFLQRALDKARATFNSPKPPKPFIPTWEQMQLRNRTRDQEIEDRLRPKRAPLPTQLPPADDAKVTGILQKRGAVFKFAREQVSSEDIARLRPCQWLNDEIINFYGSMILARSESSKENPGGKASKPLKVHYFSTFFWPKVLDGYDKSRLAKWTKKFDIFDKDVVLLAVNHGNTHWTSAAINFRQKRIEAYDSMNGDQTYVLKHLRAYVDAEHRNKKKKPFDFTGWEDYSPKDIPQQENAYDCGVFTCTILEYLSRGEEVFNFTQKHMPYIRRKMILEIATSQLRDPS